MSGDGGAPAGFPDYRDRHRGATVVVCGCGRSLASLAEPDRFLTIGVNDVGRRFTPDYLVVVNERRQFAADRYRFVEETRARAVFTQLGDVSAPRSRVVRFRLGRRGGVGPPDGETLDYTNNSPYVAVQLARHLGADRIGLIGVDFTDDHFFAATGPHPLAAHLERIDAEYAALAAACRAEGRALVNLSAASRLSSLPRARLVGGGWRLAPPAPGPIPALPSPGPAAAPRDRPTFAVDRAGTGAVGQLLDALAEAAAALGYPVRRDLPRHATLSGAVRIVWNGRWLADGGPTLFCEHGWLPRSHYQISPKGINADGDAAGFRWDGRRPAAAEAARLQALVEAVRAATRAEAAASAAPAPAMPDAFLLVPLQMERDTNIVRHAPANLRTMRALIDHVSAIDPPWPVIFKQHPADARGANAHLRLGARRPQDRIWPHACGSVHQLLGGAGCRGIVTINSNVAHDGLLWDVPAVVLGRNVWPTEGPRTPFLTAFPADPDALAESVSHPDAAACRQAYALHLLRHQWTLEEARDPGRVAPLLESVARVGSARPQPAAVRLVAKPVRRPRLPLLNVVCRNRGWLFQSWAQSLAAAGRPGFEVLASETPRAEAAAWLFVRAAEAATTPDPARTLVQIHDFAAGGIYAAGGERAAVAACAAVALAHPAQAALLAADGLFPRRVVVRPVGWRAASPLDGPAPRLPTIAWVGRPLQRGGVDASGLLDFVAAARRLPGVAVVLVGERLDAAAVELRRAGVSCEVSGLSRRPIDRAPEWLSRFDAVVVTSDADAAPWPLFDAVRAGVPVVAPPIGWAPALLADGVAGRLANGADGIAAALSDIAAARAAWRASRSAIRARVASFSFAAWARANLDLAAEVAGPGLRQAI